MISHDSCVFQCLGIRERIGLDGHDRYVSKSDIRDDDDDDDDNVMMKSKS